MDKIRVGAVSYLNTRPLLFGLKQSGLMARIELVEDYPASIAEMLLKNEIDVGLVPVVTIPRLPEAHVVTNYCIGTDNEVASVAIFSDVKMESIEKVLMDYQSRTSVRLARLLLQEYWKKDVVFENGGRDFRDSINGTTAGVVIGDRALEQRSKSAWIYDLGLAWKAYTGLPFVFAAWVANKKLDDGFITAFNTANAYGLAHFEEVVAEHPFEAYDMMTYYTRNISYDLTAQKREGLNLFLQKIAGDQ